MSHLKTIAAMGAALAISTPAFAHGDHSHNAVVNLMHWLSSPQHLLFSVIALTGLVIGYKALRNKRT